MPTIKKSKRPIYSQCLTKQHDKSQPPASKSPPPAYIPPKSPSLFNTIAEGFSFGLGSSIAHNLVGSLFENNKPESKNEDNTSAPNGVHTSEPSNYLEMYNTCLQENQNNDCSQYIEKWNKLNNI